jgi:polyphosphate kinase 2 (PPK2 family)
VVKLPHWIKSTALKIMKILEGNYFTADNGAIKRLAFRLNPSAVRIIAVPVPIDRKRS